ncbi:ATP-binding protein [Clostridium sp. WILCCON 0269]|uniref:histidine kinase n=1 Tax=Candidatus Clostridium eludens TaxID=3381663 RepID=A0ABW8SGB8_9CLOT
MKRTTDNISVMLSMIKIAIIIFIAVIIYINLPDYWAELKIKENGDFNLYTSPILSGIIALICILWFIINIKMERSSNVFRKSWLIETICFTLLISLPIYLSNSYQNEYKYLFLLLILACVIQYGSRYGIITAFFSSFFILGVDLLYAPTVNDINVYFQKDLILVGIFIFISWILGYYVDMEAENSKNKDDKLNLLNCKLKEQNIKRRNIEFSLLKNEVCFHMLFENSVNSIIVHENGKIIYANESAAKLLGYKNPLGLNDKSLYSHYSAYQITSIIEKYTNIADKKLSTIIDEENILDCSGRVITVRNTSSFFIYDGKSVILTFLLDLTSEKQMETLKNTAERNLKLLNETKEFNSLIMDFFINMSHEIKTPVNVIYVAIQTMEIYLNKYNNEDIIKCRSYLKTMKQNCLRLIRLINNIMDITKVDSGFIKINKQNGDIVSVVEDITQSVASYINSKDIELIFDTNVEEKIMAFDHDKMERIMLNLLSNAFKHTHSAGHIYVNVEDRDKTVLITVKDDGNGIPEDKLQIIFQRFGQANRSLSREHEGSGVGLYLVKSFVEMHNGKIDVTSIEGAGSEFSIELPVEIIDTDILDDEMLFKTSVERIDIEFSDIYSLTK